LDWYSCMAKCAVPIQAPFDLIGKIRKRGFEFEFKLHKVPLLLICCNYKMKNYRLCSSCYSDTRGITLDAPVRVT
jgi:hypothetical protein